MLTFVLYRLPKLDKVVEGTETVLIRHGVVDVAAMKREALSELELKSVLHKQGLNDFSEVEKCVLEPNGTFYVEAIAPDSDDVARAKILEAVMALTAEVQSLKAQLKGLQA